MNLGSSSLAGRRAPLAGPAAGGRRPWLVVAVVLSVLLHGGAMWALWPRGLGREGAEQPPTFEVEMVNQAAEQKGSSAVQPSQPPPQPAPPPEPAAQAPVPPSAPAPDVAADPKGSEPAPAPAAPPPVPTPVPPPVLPPVPPPKQEAAPGPPMPPASVNLGGAEEDQDALSVTGDNVVPPRPDARVHNRPPSYPADAVRRHAEGVVGVRIHVTEDGTPAYVDVVQSSGDASLDRSVREAVMLWRFDPARDHGTPVPFDFMMKFDFAMSRP